MASPLLNVASLVHSALKDIFLDATLARETEVLNSDPLTFTTVTYPCKAFDEAYSMDLRADGVVSENEHKVLILAGSISVKPKAGDRVTVSGTEFTILDVDSDSTKAVWECKGRM